MNEQTPKIKNGHIQKNGSIKKNGKDMLAKGIIIEKAISNKVKETPKLACTVNGETKFSNITIYPLIANGAIGAVIRVDDVTDRVRMEEMIVR